MNPMIAAGIIGGGMGIISDEINAGRNKRAAKEQEAAQKRIMEEAQKNQMEMWEATNYKPQVDQLKKAGLNPGLIYGMSGGGATTTGSSSGSAAMAAPATNSAVGGVGMGIQLGLMQAQKENIEADTKNKLADAAQSGAETDLVTTKNRLAGIEEEIARKTKDEAAEYIVQQASKAYEETQAAAMSNQITRATMESQIAQIKEEAIGAALENELRNTKIKVNEEQIKKWGQEIAQGWEGISQQDRKIKLEAWARQIEAENPGIMNVGGKIINNMIETINKIITGEKNQDKARTYKSPEYWRKNK